jgi:hypothetical protein
MHAASIPRAAGVVLLGFLFIIISMSVCLMVGLCKPLRLSQHEQ